MKTETKESQDVYQEWREWIEKLMLESKRELLKADEDKRHELISDLVAEVLGCQYWSDFALYLDRADMLTDETRTRGHLGEIMRDMVDSDLLTYAWEILEGWEA